MDRFKSPPVKVRKVAALTSFFFLFLILFFFLASFALTPHLPSEDNPITLISTDLGDDLRLEFGAAMDEAEESIAISIYSLRDRPLIQKLRKKVEEGIKVTIIHDPKASKGIRRKLGPDVEIHPRKSRGLMHHKVMVIDGRLSVVGTANFTASSLHFHSNGVVEILDVPLAQALEKAIEQLKIPGKAPPKTVQRFEIGNQTVELWLLPNTQMAAPNLVEKINQAKESIRVAMYTWTRKDVVNALIQAKARGVVVETALDASQMRGASSQVADKLLSFGIPLYVSEGNSLLHHKTAIIDEEILIIGSANWTKAAFTKNDDLYLVIEPLEGELKKRTLKMWRAILERCTLEER